MVVFDISGNVKNNTSSRICRTVGADLYNEISRGVRTKPVEVVYIGLRSHIYLWVLYDGRA